MNNSAVFDKHTIMQPLPQSKPKTVPSLQKISLWPFVVNPSTSPQTLAKMDVFYLFIVLSFQEYHKNEITECNLLILESLSIMLIRIIHVIVCSSYIIE